MSKEKIFRNKLTRETCWVGNSAKAVCFPPILRHSITSSYNLTNKWPFHFAIFTSIQFLILTSVAMFFYPGGSWIEPTTLGYPFFRTFYSELGMTVTRGGRANLTSAILFTIALTFTGLGIAVFYIALQRFFREESTISIAGSVLGTISGISCIGVALTPANLFWGTHFFLVLLACKTFLLAVLFYTIVIFKSKKYPNVYGVVYILFAVLLGGYICFWLHGRELETSKELALQAIMQKVIVLSAMVCMFIQSWGAIRQEE